MEHILNTQTAKDYSDGTGDVLGATVSKDGVNFSVFSQYAEKVYLLLFDQQDGGPTDIIPLKRTGNTWHVFVGLLKPGQLYGYKAQGAYDPASGRRFNPFKLLIDPYAKAITGKAGNPDNLCLAYDAGSPEKDLAMDQRDNTRIIPKSIVIDDRFDWQNDRPPKIPLEKMIIYEVHIKGFTAHPSSGVKDPGTFQGFIEKIPYLKDLGITAVELMPVHEFHIRNALVEKGLTDFWGYNTAGFFAPHSSYSTGQYPGCQVQEFKTFVRELHRAGIEVILDVVYNHTAEGNELGPTLSLKGLDNPTYYRLMQGNENEPYRYYKNDTGCGNTVNLENPAAMRLVLDSLRYWAEVMHVDGFRFDLASVLARVKNQFSRNSAFFEAVANDPVLSKVKLIAEPWDLTTYQVGHFPAGWSEWNGRFRDTARKFLKGDDGMAADMAKRLTGSADLYQDDGRRPYNSINFITCHDGFTMRDLYSYDQKHNEANNEDNQDGNNDNSSWNCGTEGETDDPGVVQLRKQMIKNAVCCLLFSSGTPMMLYGDEVMRTQKGNNNAYCQDNETTWLNWDFAKKHSELLEFWKKAIEIRKKCAVLESRRFFSGKDHDGDNEADISWFDSRLGQPVRDDPKTKTICYRLDGSEAPSALGDYSLFFIFNADPEPCVVSLPPKKGFPWRHMIDTSQQAGEGFASLGQEKALENQERYSCRPRSIVVLIAKK